MRFCSKNPKNLTDELRCPVNQLGLVVDILKRNPQTTLVIEITNSANLEEIEKIKNLKIPYKIATKDVSLIPSFLPFVFLDFPVTDWETAKFLLDAGVKELFLAGPLMFDLPQIEYLKNQKGIAIRCNPCYCYKKEQVSPSNFFIRPEAVSLYEDAITTFDFCESNSVREKALLDIYKQGSFDGQLNHYILNQTSIENSIIPEIFDKIRLNCKQECLKPFSTCHYCENCFKTLNLIKEKANGQR